ncbi:MAG TPA: glycosyltransferase family 39 protein [Anaerolineae bacterium]|nr:glycosyltransferase family 39 protein [Anaerolineae bacterium]HQH39916.1 glycosyltransferase family 39 protein [Anaerolineae bacterium]
MTLHPSPSTLHVKPAVLSPAVGILLLTLLVRVAWLALFPTDPIAPVDAEGYHLLALNMLAGHGFALYWEPPFCPTMVRTPLYPLFVAGIYALMGRDPVRVLPVQLLWEVLTTALVMRLGRDLGGKRTGWWAGVLYACNGTTQRYTGYLLSETLLLPLLTASVWMTLRCLRHPTLKKSALAGLFWGLSILTKPNVQFLALFVGGLLSGRIANQRIGESAHQHIECRELPSPTTRNSPLQTQITHHVSPRFMFLAFWLVLAVVLFPWLLRNRLVFNRWMLSTAFEENLARVSAVATLAEIEGVRAEPWTETWEYYYERLVADVRARYDWPARSANGDGCMELQQRQIEIAQVSREVVRAHLFPYLRAHLRGVLTSIVDPGHRLWYSVLTGADWESTGVVADMGARMMWSLERGAVGDALRALWLERIVRPPLPAALLWWGLTAARIAVWVLGWRGAWRLRHRPWALPVLVGTVAYMLLLPGPIAYDRFYLPAIPIVVVLMSFT